MALTDDQVGPRAAWLRRHRKRKYGAGDPGLVALAKAMRDLGFERAWQTYKGWETSDERSPIQAEAEPYLERLFGEPVPDPRPIGTGGDVAAAITAQTETLTKLLDELRQERVQRDVFLGQMAQTLGLLAHAAGVRLPDSLSGIRVEAEREDDAGTRPDPSPVRATGA